MQLLVTSGMDRTNKEVPGCLGLVQLKGTSDAMDLAVSWAPPLQSHTVLGRGLR